MHRLQEARGAAPLTPFILGVLLGAVVVLDQLTKLAVVVSLDVGESRPLIGDVLFLSHVRNTGAAFGILPGASGILAVVALAGILVGVLVLSRRPARIVAVGTALVAGGALGNLIDRVARGFPFHGSVVDFIDFRFWPAFNVADSAVTVGVGLLLLASFGRTRDA